MISVENILRASHIAIFAGAGLMSYGLYRVHSFRPGGAPAPLPVYLAGGAGAVLGIGAIAHYAFKIKTKGNYALGLNDYPKYTLY